MIKRFQIMNRFKVSIALFSVLAFFKVNAQSIIPTSNKYKFIGKVIVKPEKPNIEKSVLKETNDLQKIDKTISKDESDNVELGKIIDSLNGTNRFRPILSAGIGNLDNLRKAFGSAQIGGVFRLTNFRMRGKWIDPHYVYLMFGCKTNSSEDTNSILKSIVFPELIKRAFVMGYYFEISKDNFSIAPTIEFSINKYKDTVSINEFSSTSFLLGSKFNYFTTVYGGDVSISVFPYISIIDIDPKYNKAYHSLTNGTEIHNTFDSFGLMTSFQFEKAILFCNMKYIVNDHRNVTNPDLVRFVYTIGSTIAF